MAAPTGRPYHADRPQQLHPTASHLLQITVKDGIKRTAGHDAQLCDKSSAVEAVGPIISKATIPSTRLTTKRTRRRAVAMITRATMMMST
jgi:hypothetical protein